MPPRKRFGAVLENVVHDRITRVPDFDDGSKTENTRSAYPLDFIPNASRTGRAGQPKNWSCWPPTPSACCRRSPG